MPDALKHEDLIEAWGKKYPREHLAEDGKPTIWGERALKILRQYPVADVQRAMFQEEAHDGPKKLEHVYARLKTIGGVIQEKSWLEGASPGSLWYRTTPSGRRTIYGIKVEEIVHFEPHHELWTLSRTPLYEKPHFTQVLPRDMEQRWNNVNINKELEVKDEWRAAVKEGRVDGGCPRVGIADALRIDHQYVDMPQTPRPQLGKGESPRAATGPSAIADVPIVSTNVPNSITDDAEAAAIKADYVGSDEPDPEVLF
jgi:hypothetical protein